MQPKSKTVKGLSPFGKKFSLVKSISVSGNKINQSNPFPDPEINSTNQLHLI